MVRSATYVFVAVILFCGLGTNGQVNTKPAAVSKPTWTRIDPLGGVTLPKGFSHMRTKDFPDAWIGVITSEDQKFVINFAAGMAGLNGLTRDKKELIWEKTDQIKVWPDKEPFPLRISLWKVKKKQYIQATVNWAKFSANVKDSSEQETFISIVSSYRSLPQFIKQSSMPGPCKTF